MESGCCVFLHRRLGYHDLAFDGYSDDEASSTVTVVVGKERRVFVVDAFVLEEESFRILMGVMGKKGIHRRRGFDGKDVIFLDVDSILFEHLLWLVSKHEFCSLVHLNLKEIIEFYAQDY